MLRDEVVWAIDWKHLPNYLLPRDCPRVCYYPTATTSESDRKHFIGKLPHCHVVAIEETWVRRAINEPIWLYELPSRDFSLLDPGAGYYVSRKPAAPVSKRLIRYPLEALEQFDVSLRVVDDLEELQNEVVRSTLQYSCIRMRKTRSRLSVVA